MGLFGDIFKDMGFDVSSSREPRRISSTTKAVRLGEAKGQYDHMCSLERSAENNHGPNREQNLASVRQRKDKAFADYMEALTKYR